jgi:alpha-L-fucosidase 2
MYGGIRKDEEIGNAIGYITDGSYIVFRNLDFESGAEGFRVSAASATEGGTIEIRIGASDGELIGKCDISGTDGWNEYQEMSCKTDLCTGAHDVYLVFKGDDGYLFNVGELGFYGIKGDINGDRHVDVFDMIRYRKALTSDVKLTGLSLSNADVNGDSEAGIADAVMLQKLLLGKAS